MSYVITLARISELITYIRTTIDSATNTVHEEGAHLHFSWSLVTKGRKRDGRSVRILVKARGGSGVKKTSLAYIKVQPVMELLLFTESQNLRL